MWSHVINPRRYLIMGLYENTYLITALLMVMMLVVYFFETVIVPKLRRRPLLAIPVQSMAYAFLMAAVFVYLKPIRQLIYFQF